MLTLVMTKMRNTEKREEQQIYFGSWKAADGVVDHSQGSQIPSLI